MKKRRNLTKAEREAMESFQALQRKWDAVPKFARSNIGNVKKQGDVTSAIPKLTTPPGRQTPHYPSLSTNGAGGTKPIKPKQYTGSAMIGIGTLHKSNAVPVFNTEEAAAMARMRRG